MPASEGAEPDYSLHIFGSERAAEKMRTAFLAAFRPGWRGEAPLVIKIFRLW
jgi:hypothetical protein